MVEGGCSGDDAGSCILDKLEFMEEFVRETKEEGITVICAGSDERVNRDGGPVGSE